jgi:hypothetical protein
MRFRVVLFDLGRILTDFGRARPLSQKKLAGGAPVALHYISRRFTK